MWSPKRGFLGQPAGFTPALSAGKHHASFSRPRAAVHTHHLGSGSDSWLLGSVSHNTHSACCTPCGWGAQLETCKQERRQQAHSVAGLSHSPSILLSQSLFMTRRAGCSISLLRMTAAAARPYCASSAGAQAASKVKFLHVSSNPTAHKMLALRACLFLVARSWWQRKDTHT
jgi:hypothetical protein